jgi:hypothetical protein
MPELNGDQPTHEAHPKKSEPIEIPIPTRKAVFRDLEKVAKPRKPPADKSSE